MSKQFLEILSLYISNRLLRVKQYDEYSFRNERREIEDALGVNPLFYCTKGF